MVDTTRFANLTALNAYAHSKGVLMGWYGNCCGCSKGAPYVQQDVEATVAFGFDGIKVDGCGPEHNISEWVAMLEAADRDLLLENCGDNHQTWTPPDPRCRPGPPISGSAPLCLFTSPALGLHTVRWTTASTACTASLWTLPRSSGPP